MYSQQCLPERPQSQLSSDEESRGNRAGELSGANDGSSPATGAASLPSTAYDSVMASGPATLLSASPVPDLNLDPDNMNIDACPCAEIAAGMTRLRPPPSKFKSLVAVLERERVQGNTRVAFSQLGSMLRAEDPSVYKRAGAKQLRDYAAMAEEEGIVILGTSDWENGNRWTALHPTYHGKPPEVQVQPASF